MAGVQQWYVATIKTFLLKTGEVIDRRFHTSRKIASANHWSKKNPHKFFRLTIFSGVIIVITSVLPSFISCHRQDDKLGMRQTTAEIARTSDLIDRLQSLEAGKRNQRELIGEIAGEFQSIRMEIDSLKAKKNLSRQDSIHLAIAVRKLQIIYSNLKNNEKD